MMARQLSFDWPNGVALGPDDFFVSTANATAFGMVTDPDRWPLRKLVIAGPAGCGKSHLARIFAAAQPTQIIAASDLTPDFVPTTPALVVEDMDNLPADAQESMFHLHNHLQNNAGLLLMTARQTPARWPISLPDLASRMQGSAVVQVADPDDALLQAVMMKLFADRQILPPAGLTAYLAPRIERSFAAAADIVARLDEAALATGHKINLRLAARLLDNPD
ncbi:chromosomal replication initiator DnaA [Yoonia sp.]|uniref:chromosomal replication initiator DnaA n=1 Tax=Yoonia sp. TaxID=2212373 RepID=UPI00391D0DCB